MCFSRASASWPLTSPLLKRCNSSGLGWLGTGDVMTESPGSQGRVLSLKCRYGAFSFTRQRFFSLAVIVAARNPSQDPGKFLVQPAQDARFGDENGVDAQSQFGGDHFGSRVVHGLA